MSLSYWVCVAITVISAAVSFGYAVAAFRTAVPASKNASDYALARSTALLAVALAAFFVNSAGFAAAVAVAMVLVQAIDAGIGARIRDPLKTYGPALTAVANLAALVWMVAA